MSGPIVQPPYVLSGVHAAAPVTSGWTVTVDADTVPRLDDLQDVDTTGETSGDVLRFDGAQWRPAVPAVPVGSAIYHVQQAVTTVQITHGLPFDPAGITVVDGTGVPTEYGSVTYPAVGVVELGFDVPFTGTVHLS